MVEDDAGAVDPARAVEMRLRARLAVVERAAWFGFVQAMRAQPEATQAFIEAERARCRAGFGGDAWARDLTAAERARCRAGFGGDAWARDLTAAERALLGAEVDSGLAQLVADARAEIGTEIDRGA